MAIKISRKTEFDDHNCMYREIFNNKHTVMLIIDPKSGKIFDANRAACNFYGYDYIEFLNKSIYEINVSTKEDILEDMSKARDGSNKWFRFKHRITNGEVKDVEVFSGPIKYKDKDLLFSIIHNVEELVKLESQFSTSKMKHDYLFNNSHEAIAILDDNFMVIDINQSFKKIFQYDLEEIRGKDITDIVCDDKLCHISYGFRERAKEGHLVRAQVKRRRRDGSLVEVTLMLIPIMDEGKLNAIYCIYLDMTAIKSKEEEINKLINKDRLTNLGSRNYFIENLARRILLTNDKENFAVLSLGLNELDEINHALGSHIADDLLLNFANIIEKNSTPENTPSRIDNNIFSLIIPDFKSIEEAQELANRFKENCEKQLKVRKYDFDCRVSAGISIYPDHSLDELGLIEKSKLALVKSMEAAGSQTIRYEEFLVRELQESFWLKQNLAHAVNNKELILNYQPIYDTGSNTLIGSEALLRWKHRKAGIIPPLKFIPLAEETGLIHEIGRWVMHEACRQNKAWQDIGYRPIYISVNSSIIEFKSIDFVDSVKNALKSTGLDPKYLQIEITESFLADDFEAIRDNIRDLRRMGVKISIDDFGTGYSSLEKLGELNVNSLKIDKSFIDEIQTNENKRKIVNAIVLLAKALNLDTIAEGIEFEAQINTLKQMGCSLGQGFYFSQALDSDIFEKLLA